ncbi:unnamed protein product [Caenorhabditis auriculariae]|uniref:Uncharacterized protein n=1 Tax=Caenorhabditis auriculariae TaxID=2777116 RepID=A0A8S1HKB9_9PELO|nr:unnamed protein product [Caenorhabditis auriculariae]
MTSPGSFSLLDPTVTPFSYRDRITWEFELNASSYFLNFLLCVFLRSKKQIWGSLKSTIVFGTVGSLVQNIPLLGFQAWMVFHLQAGVEPQYTILMSIKSCLSQSRSTDTEQWSEKRNPAKITFFWVHVIVTLVLIGYSFMNFPIGVNIRNDVCKILRFSNTMEALRIVTTLGMNIAAILVNLSIMRCVSTFEQNHSESERHAAVCSPHSHPKIAVLAKTSESVGVGTRRNGTDVGEILRAARLRWATPAKGSCINTAQTPLAFGGIQSAFADQESGAKVVAEPRACLQSYQSMTAAGQNLKRDVPVPSSIGDTWYALTFLGPFLTPLSSVLSLPSTRKALISTITCGVFQKPPSKNPITVMPVHSRTITIRDDE